MSKKNSLMANMKRPSLKRDLKVSEGTMEKVVQEVADNPPPAKEKAPSPKATARPAAKASQRTSKTSQPKTSKAATPAKSTPPVAREERKRLTLDIPKSLHKRLKLLVLQKDTTMRDYIVDVVEQSLK